MYRLSLRTNGNEWILMQKLLEKYFKIFQLEGRQGYENKAVMGGI